ncbi:small-conductance mechanosensitive channel [Terriglobus roseus DSM 18391]|uniref:Small-conductance mechanosensitive channel n=1 Tax=Terriglobus roseus (strain DSM 18391 / NRRL B-41598 / KBS 63) TaxID=926566 RepID=I3ZLF2_TERRK|nr:mechanosensitive ion channel domain-containing protein [Terriglobus roseus]AFL90070.1 small-conductance mechanosensitive channel [Terriglobus roseus DSM 18391]
MRAFPAKSLTLPQRVGLWLLGCVVVIIFAVANVGTDLSLSQFSAPAEAPSSNTSVDQSLYVTARNLAALAATPQEQQYAVLAMRSADHELDQSFASVIRNSASQRLALTPAAVSVLQRAAELKQVIQADRAAVAAASAEGSDAPDGGDERLRTAQAQLVLDQDELENVQQDIAQMGGDPQTDVQQAFDQHRALESQAAILPRNAAPAALESSRSLHSVVGKVRILASLKERRSALIEARTKALAAQHRLQQQHEVLTNKSSVPPSGKDPASRAGKLANLQAAAEREKDMTVLDKRVRDLGQLAAVYEDWIHLMQSQRRALLASLAGDFLTIVMAVLGVFALSGLAQYLINRWEKSHHHRLKHPRVVITLFLEVVVVARIAVVIFGMPGDVSTIIGFVTAGITVTLKDFLVSFVGWFALMGRRGVQVGDWVEIDGTQGEVLEVTALHTYLLEVGNWATSGQFTGRQAVFMNKYAVEKKYFNFSTSEQWMWDELVIPVPATKSITQQMLAQVQQLIAAETQDDLAAAEASWGRLAATNGLEERKGAPTAVVRTSATGLEVVARYVTTAPAHFATAVRLRQVVLGALGLGLTADPDVLNSPSAT